jgi:hypothetical protein
MATDSRVPRAVDGLQVRFIDPAAGTHNDLLHSSELCRHLHYVRFNEFRD